MDAIYWASAEVLATAAQLAGGRDGVRERASADVLRTQMLDLLRRMVVEGRAAGVADAALAEARYAAVAYIDECVLKSEWPGRTEWMSNPLQLQLFREYTAGENFFARMRALMPRPDMLMALQVYYLCLALGFTGATGNAPGGGGHTQNVAAMMQAARVRLAQGGAQVPISPHAIPPDRAGPQTLERSRALAFAVACGVVVLLGLVLLSHALGKTVDAAKDDVVRASSSSAGPGSR